MVLPIPNDSGRLLMLILKNEVMSFSNCHNCHLQQRPPVYSSGRLPAEIKRAKPEARDERLMAKRPSVLGKDSSEARSQGRL